MNDEYFKEQIIHSAHYFQKWLSKNNDELIDFEDNLIKDSKFYDLHKEFTLHYKIKKGNENEITHNCIACNLEEGLNNIRLFFKYNINSTSERYFLTIYTLLFYLQAERMGVIYKELGYTYTNKKKQQEFDWSSFPTLKKIKCWANFFKHPKTYMMLHHPMFFVEGDPSIPNLMINGEIDDSFISKYYDGGSLNDELREKLLNKSRFIIIFPNLLEFTKILCNEFDKIVTLIISDEKHILKLSQLTTIISED